MVIMKTNWQIKKLGDVCNIVNGATPLRSNKEFWNNGDVSWFTIDDIREQGRIIRYTKQKITRKALTKNSERLLPSESILLCCTASVGEYAITEIPLTTNQQFNGLVIKDRKILDPIFLYYFSSTLKDQLLGLSGKTTIDFIPISRLKGIEISFPVLSEQKRIVKVLNEVFKKVEKAKKNAEQNLQNSKKLFESYLQSAFINSKYEYKPLGSICEVIGGGTPSKTGSNFTKFYNGSIPWATVRDMRNEIITETEHKITKEAVKDSSTNIIPKGNVVIATRVGLGKVCLIENDTAINQDLRGIVPINKEKLLVGYLFQWLKSIAHVIKEEGTGATVQGVKLPFIKSLLIPVPRTLTEQKAIVKKLNELSNQTKKLEVIYKKKLADLEELKKSVLKKAFTGML
jgi:restriction endonuclease S subunit